MTFATAAALDRHDVGVSLFISGIPYLFGTVPGLVHPSGSTEPDSIINPPAAGLTSVAAIDVESVDLGAFALNLAKGRVDPGNLSFRIFKDPTWDPYMRRRDDPQLYVADDPLDSTATTLNVSDTTGITAGMVLHVEREAIKVGTVAAINQFTGCTRRYCTLPMMRTTSHQNGRVISTRPRHHIGRWAELRLWLANGQESQILQYLFMSASPKESRDKMTWELSFNDMFQTFDRKLCVGVKGSKVSRDSSLNLPNFEMIPTSGDEFQSGAGTNGMLMLDVDTGGQKTPYFLPIDSIDSGTVFINATTICTYMSQGTPLLAEYMRRVYDLSLSPLRAFLHCALSDRGDGANDNVAGDAAEFDDMFGVTDSGDTSTNRLEDGTEIRYGAAIPASLIDVTGILAQDADVDGWGYMLGADGREVDLLEIMEEVADARGGYFLGNSSGQCTFKVFDATYPNDTYDNAITEDHILRQTPLESVDDESEIIHTLNIACNYGRGGVFYGQMNAYYWEEKQTYREVRGTLDVKRKGLYVDFGGSDVDFFVSRLLPKADPETIRLGLDRKFARTARGLRRYQLILPWRFVLIWPGDRITVTCSLLPDFAGGTLDETPFEVYHVERNYKDLTVTVSIQDTWAGRLIGPTGIVSSYSAGPPRVVTLSASTMFGDNGHPAGYFAPGWRVRWLRAAASPRHSTQDFGIVLAVTGNTTLTLTAVPTTAPASGDYFRLNRYDATDVMTENTEQGATQHDYGFLADTGFRLGDHGSTGPDKPHRYG